MKSGKKKRVQTIKSSLIFKNSSNCIIICTSQSVLLTTEHVMLGLRIST